MDYELEGLVAAVTGAGSGIGLCTAELLSAEGAQVVGIDLDAGAAAKRGIASFEADLTEPASCERAVAMVHKTFGRLDVLVNGVGVMEHRAGFLETTPAEWSESLSVTFLTAVNMSRAALPLMIESGAGSLIHIASAAAHQPRPSAPDYAAAKAALLSLSKCLSIEFGARGIRSNAVSPGPTRTPPVTGWIATRAEEEGRTAKEIEREFAVAERRMALPKLGEPADVANAVAYLASPLSGQMTGSEIRVDGGAVQSL